MHAAENQRNVTKSSVPCPLEARKRQRQPHLSSSRYLSKTFYDQNKRWRSTEVGGRGPRACQINLAATRDDGNPFRLILE